MKHWEKYFTLNYLARFGTLEATIVALLALQLDAPRIKPLLQANPFGPAIDSVVLIIALIALSLMLYLSLLSGAVGAWLFEQVFKATLFAAVQIRHVWHLGISFLGLVAPAIQYVPTDLLLHRRFEKRHLAYLLAKLPSRSTLPYELFPVTCILLS